MSTCEPSGGDPIPAEPDHLTADGHYIPPDPLLKPGTFISNLDPTGPQPAQNGVSEHVQPNPHGAREPVSDEPELPATPRADVSNFKDGTATPAADGAESAQSGRKGAPQAVDFDSLPERPKWLPEGWRVDYKVRSSGASAGSIDRGGNKTLTCTAKTLPEFDPVAAEHIMLIFIDLNVIPKEEGRILAKEEEAQNNDTRNTEPTQNGTQKLKHYKPDPSKNLISDISNCGDALKMTMLVVETTTKPLPSQRSKRGPARAALSVPLQKRPEWLPCGWWIDYRVRSSGAFAGLVDKYYFEPLSGRRFRSKKEVDYFIQTGSKRKRKTNPDADVNSSADPGGHQQKKSASRMESSAPLNFDFNNEPEKVRWVLTDALKDKWTPFVGDKLVPKSTRQEWNAAFRLSRS